MLQQVMAHLNNYFVPISARLVKYTISGGVISPSFGAEDGDRFLICGSRRNDGVYTFHAGGIKNDDDNKAAGLQDETFAGTIRVCSIPPMLLALSGEISQWVATYSAQLNSPLQSESFNGYSYTVKGSGGSNGGGPFTWRDQFRPQLDQWRRLSL